MSKVILLTKAEAAKAISSSVRHVDNLEKRGLITPVREGRWVRYPLSELEALPSRLAGK
jgi:DNA-binding transcriptional ArsR family regulator